MTEPDALVSSSEDNFWRSFMPAGTAAPEAMSVDQSGQATGAQKAEGGQVPTEDDKGDSRGGKWVKDNQKGKGRTQQGGPSEKWATSGGQGRGSGNGRRSGQDKDKDSKWYGRQWHEDETESLKRQLASVQRLLMRHEDAINVLKAEHSYVLHMKINIPSSIVPSLSKARAGWHALRSEKPQEITRPMRVTLWTCVLQEWLARLVALPSVPETMENLEKLGWYIQAKNEFPYLQWKADTQQLVPDTGKTPLPYEQSKAMLQDLIRVSVSAGVISRFFPTRPLAAEMRGESVTFLLQLCMRGDDSQRAHEVLNAFCGSACSLVVGMQIKPDRGVRSGLAQAISAEIPQ